MNTIIDLAKKHLQDMPENSEVLKADLIKVIKVAEQLEQQLKILNIPVVIDESFLAILDAYQVECQMKYNTGTVPDAREWFAKNYSL